MCFNSLKSAKVKSVLDSSKRHYYKNVTSQLVGHDLDSRKLSRDLLKEFQKLHCYRLQISITQALAIDNFAWYNPLWIYLNFDRTFSKTVDNCLLINFAKNFDITGKMLTDLKFYFLFLFLFLKIWLIFAIFWKEGNLEVVIT